MASRKKLEFPRELILPTIMNNSFSLTRSGAKEIIVGNRQNPNFSTCIKILKHTDVPNGIDLEPNEWDELVANVSEIDLYLKHNVPRPNIMLGSVRRSLEFTKIKDKSCVVIGETLAPPGLYARQIFITESTWTAFKDLIPSIDCCIKRCLADERKLQFIFDKLCDTLKYEAAQYDRHAVQTKLFGMKCPEDVLHNQFYDDITVGQYKFYEVQRGCVGFIFDTIMERNLGLQLKSGY